tara:strand:- start:433 stop:612 length:180 start_codon:yes stop_codon:yes gene_type:complete
MGWIGMTQAKKTFGTGGIGMKGMMMFNFLLVILGILVSPIVMVALWIYWANRRDRTNDE